MLILALVFLVIVSGLVVALLDWSGNNLNSVAAFQQGSGMSHAANSAMETAIKEVRYSPTACPSTGLSIPANGITIDVWCSPNPETESGTSASRQITFTVCANTAFTAGTCSSSPTSTNPPPYLTVVATFDDYSNLSPIGSAVLCSATCGTTMRINSWVFSDT